MATINLKNVEKLFGTHHAVRPMNLSIEDGEFVVLLGPSGCGKTTTLRMIAGLEAVTHGQIFFNDKEITWLHPSERDIAFVFQFFALYSHMSCQDNIAFPLLAQGMDKTEIKQRVSDVAQLLRIEGILKSRPGSLSGGDQQRVALARALVRNPAAFMMDEPLGALDAEFRDSMRAEIKQLHIDQHATTVYVTHDQVEAMAMGDKIVVMSAAEIQQVGTPIEVYHNPANIFVARFIGSPGMNLVEATYSQGYIILEHNSRLRVPSSWQAVLNEKIGNDQPVILGFRPEAVEMAEAGVFPSTVYGINLYGGYTMLVLQLENGEVVEARVSRSDQPKMDEMRRFNINPDMIRFFDPKTQLALVRDDNS
ncbi:ABC transporter ATP-binding protein [Anaerolineales bacterium]